METPEEQQMTQKLWWLAFKAGDDYKLSFCPATSQQDAVRYCRQHVLYRELVAVFSNDLPLTPAQMLELAPVLQQTGSPLMTAVVV